MSIGDLTTYGNKGNNFPWQLKMLQGLQCICDEVKEINIDTDDLEQLLADLIAELAAGIDVTVVNGSGASAVNIQDGGNSITVDGGTGVQRTPTFLRPTGTSGTVAAGTFSMSFASVGTANATVGGITLKPGETINFDAGAINNTLGAVTYSTTTAGAELIIITLT
jgi:hypothetical protein